MITSWFLFEGIHLLNPFFSGVFVVLGLGRTGQNQASGRFEAAAVLPAYIN